MFSNIKYALGFAILGILNTTSAHAQYATLSADEVAEATAECEISVSYDCLFTLALDAVVTNLDDPHRNLLPAIILTQLYVGDLSGAKRSMAFGRPNYGILLKFGRWDEASALAKEEFPNWIVEGGTPESSYLNTLVRAQMEFGEVEMAIETALASGPDNTAAWHSVMKLLIEQGAYIRATEFATTAQSERFEQDAYLNIVFAQSNAGLIADAINMLPNIESNRHRCLALVAIANAQISVGDADDARQNLVRAFEIASGENIERHGSSQLLIEIAEAQHAASFIPDAQNSARQAFNMSLRYTSSDHLSNSYILSEFVQIGIILFRAGLEEQGKLAFEKAEELVASVSGEGKEYRAQLVLQLGRLEIGEPGALNGLLELVQGPLAGELRNKEALEQSVQDMVEKGYLAEALAVTQILINLGIVSEYRSDRIRANIVEAYLELGESETALNVALKMRSIGLHGNAVKAVAQILNEDGQTIEAREILFSFLKWSKQQIDNDDRNDTLSPTLLLATMLGEFGYATESREFFQNSFELAQQIENRFEYVEAIRRIAGALHQTFPNSPN